MIAIVEIPARHAVYPVAVLPADTVSAALIRTPLNLDHIEKVTYDGEIHHPTPAQTI